MRLKYQFTLIQAIRNYFIEQGFIDVLTPPMVENPGMETHIHPFEVWSKNSKESTNKYLHTSPEFYMKELLSLPEEELDKIFSVSYCFRDEPESEIHRPQFLMLEWYRKDERYEKIMEDCTELIKFCAIEFNKKGYPLKKEYKSFSVEKFTVQEIVQKYCGFDILDFLDKDHLLEKIKSDFPDVPLPSSECDWDDYFFLLFLNKVEPHFKDFPVLLLYEFPAPLAALSTLKETDNRVCERFEIYLEGVELCNCFNELTDLNIQKERFAQQALDKKRLYGYELNAPEGLYNTLERGLPQSAGVALGVERLLRALTGIENPFYK